jgi:hypothetical protein
VTIFDPEPNAVTKTQTTVSELVCVPLKVMRKLTLMDLEVKQENIVQILKDVRELLRDNILPRLTNVEEEVRLLRKVTWPICQGLRERTQVDDIQCKREFLQHLDPDEVLMLLKIKSKGLLIEEYTRLNLQNMQ